MNYFIEVIPGESVFCLAYAKGNREGECVKKDYGNVILVCRTKYTWWNPRLTWITARWGNKKERR